MLRKINVSLGIIALLGALFIGGFFMYTHFNTVQNSEVIQEIEGGLE